MTADGIIFWSFTRLPAKVSPPVRLVMRDKKGTLLGLFTQQLKNLVNTEEIAEEEIVELTE
jgi:hypothetical protein